MRAVIVGGGVAGPAVAIALARVGLQVVVLERRSATDAATGSYLTVAPNGLSALQALGVLDEIAAAGFRSRRNVMYGAGGRYLGAVGLGPPVREDLVGLTLPRSVLAARLSVLAAAHGVEIRRGSAVAAVTGTGHGVTATDGTRLRADVVVGADGVHSAVRRWIDPAAPPARYVGLTNFGGITRGAAAGADLEPQAWHFVFGRRAFFGAHPTPDGDAVWFVNVPGPAITRAQRASTTSQAWRSRLAGMLDDDAGPAAALVRAGELELAADNTFDLAHVPTWSRGRAVLVGDAAHAPSPSSGQGVSLALEDAVVLGQALRDRQDVPAAFDAFERARRRRVERVVAVGARTSSAKIPGPIGRRVTETMMGFAFRHVVTDARSAWINGHRLTWDAPVPA